MKWRNKRLAAAMCALALAVTGLVGCTRKPEPAEPPATEPAPTETRPEPVSGNYLSAAATEDGFLAVGTGGRADRITADGQAERLDLGTDADLHCVWHEDGETLICGSGGTLLRGVDNGGFEKVDLGVDMDLFSVAKRQGRYYVGAEKGSLFYSDDLENWHIQKMQTDCDIISVVATEPCVAAITAETDVMISRDGVTWDQSRFNDDYANLYPPYVFTRAVGAVSTFFVVGYHRDLPGQPLIMFTETGEVWIQKMLSVFNGEDLPESGLRINDLGFSVDQIVGACNGGQVAAITECVVCHQLKELEGAGDILAVAVREDGILLCGSDWFYQVIESRFIRQDKIKGEQAWEDMSNYGAVLIDVREESERQESGYVPESVHIPLADIEEQLPIRFPDRDTELIFYCAVGGRAQTALEKALDMGYEHVYNLGGLSDWPYEIVINDPAADQAGGETE